MNFEELKAKASGVLDTVANAASHAAGAAKTSVSVYAEEEKIKTAYQAIGKLYYADSKAGCPASGQAYDEQIAKIESALARIQELRAKDSVVPESSAEEPAVGEKPVTEEEPVAEEEPVTAEEPVTEEDFVD